MNDTNDMELIELAAHAAGYQLDRLACGDKFNHINTGGHDKENWNPLTDDGDALRLAVKLRLRVATPTDDTDCAVAGKGDVRGVHVKAYSGEITEPYAATRRAIVRAAAEIGRAML